MRLYDELLMQRSQKENRKITLTEAAKVCDVSPSRLMQVLTGVASCKRKPELLKIIARYFDISLKDLKKRIEAEK